jgi:hypothetical protein
LVRFMAMLQAVAVSGGTFAEGCLQQHAYVCMRGTAGPTSCIL